MSDKPARGTQAERFGERLPDGRRLPDSADGLFLQDRPD